MLGVITKNISNKWLGFEGHDSRAVANFFVALSQRDGSPLTILSLIKYVYLAHGWTLGLTGKPLIRDKVEAWGWGPVIPEVYDAFLSQGIFVKDQAKNWLNNPYRAKFLPKEEGIMKEVYDRYSGKEEGALADVDLELGTPWSDHAITPFAVIDNKKIKDYYTALSPEWQSGD